MTTKAAELKAKTLQQVRESFEKRVEPSMLKRYSTGVQAAGIYVMGEIEQKWHWYWFCAVDSGVLFGEDARRENMHK
jgi:hypothetical protein